MSKLQTRNAFSNASLQDSDLFWIEVDLGGGIFESQKITGLQLKTILSQDPIVNDVVLIDQNTPTTGGVTFNPNTPLTQDILYLSTTNGSTWIYNGSAYVTYVMPVTSTTPFNIYGSSVDAGGNKTTSIQRTGDIYVGTNSLNSIVSSSTGLAHTSNGFSQVFSTTYSNSEYPIIRQTRRRGTQASSTPAQSGDILGTHSFNSNGDSASISVKATETHGLTTRGSEIILSNCANGTASQVENLKVQQDGKIKVSNAYTLPSTAPTSGQVLGYSSAGVSDWVTASGGLTKFTEAESTTTPNATTYVDSITANGSTTNVDVSIKPKGSGSFLLAVPDNTATGGNKRGQYAVDLQITRNANTQVSSGANSSILGGLYNTVSGSYATAMGYQNTVGGDGSFCFGGLNTTNSSNYSFCLGRSNTSNSTSYSGALGLANNASGTNASMAIGYSNTASGISSIAIGYINTSSGNYSVALGTNASTFSIISKYSYGSPQFNGAGDNQLGALILSASTTGNTATTLTSDRSTASTINQLILQNQQLIRFKGTVMGKQQTSTNAGVWEVDGVIVRGANAGTTTLVVSNVNLVTNASGWGTPTLTADTTNGGLQVQVTGLTATNIKWNCRLDTIELINA